MNEEFSNLINALIFLEKHQDLEITKRHGTELALNRKYTGWYEVLIAVPGSELTFLMTAYETAVDEGVDLLLFAVCEKGDIVADLEYKDWKDVILKEMSPEGDLRG